MIRSAGQGKDGTPFVMLGLDAQNLARVREGQPIQVNLRHLDPDGPPVEQLPDLNVIIYFAGSIEQEALARLLFPQTGT